MVAALSFLGVIVYGCFCDHPYVPEKTSPSYDVYVLNNLSMPLYVNIYSNGHEDIYKKSDVVEPDVKKMILGFAGVSSGGAKKFRYEILSNVDNSLIAETTLVTEPMTYEGVDYQTNITLNADKTLTIKTIPMQSNTK